MAGLFRKIVTQAFELNQVQENVAAALKPLADCPLNHGKLLRNQSLAAGADNAVAHGLGRKPRGWLVVGRRGPAAVWESGDPNPFPARVLMLRCDAEVMVDLWVF